MKYRDPSRMFNLPECNIASAISAELYRNQNVILGMSILNGIGKSVMTGLCGGDGNEMTQAFLEGMIEGAAMGMLFCAVAAVMATGMATILMTYTAASSIVSIVMAVYSVSEGNNLSALIYAVTAVAGIISVCKWWGVNVQVDYVGERGIARFAGGSGSNTVKKSLPNVEKATINPNKLTGYALNPEHPVGGNKAKVFESALGYNQSNADNLMKQIYEKLSQNEAILGKLDQYGQRYTVDIPITGPNGNTVNVRSGWIIKTGSDVPELTTIFVK